MLTQEQSRKYIEQSGVNCPHCNSSNIEGGSMDMNAGNIYQNIWCNDCQEEWTDEYALVGVTETEVEV